MLPNWLLGKSKSKLIEELGGGGGGGGGTSYTATSNPNIFHNPWFSVNQRAITSATRNADYIADRWMVYFGENNATITRNDDGNIVMNNSLGTTNITIYQKRTQTYLKSLVGQKLTASMMLSDGTIYSGTITYTGTGNPVYFENDYVKAHAPALTASQIITFSVKRGASVTIKALKLELGEVSTLAMDPRPEYAIELAKCQRYFIRLKNNDNASDMPLTLGVGVNTLIIFELPLPSQMRTKPTVSASSVRIDKPGSTSPTGTPTLTMKNIAGNIARIDVSGFSPTAGGIYSLTLANGGGYIDFNAEL